MTPRRVTAWGLIAGVSIADQKEMTPGFLCDLYVLRRAYDDEQHGITREKDDHDLTDEDAELFDHIDEIKEAEKTGGWTYAEGNQDHADGGR